MVHVLDASRSVPVAQTLLDKKTQVRGTCARGTVADVFMLSKH